MPISVTTESPGIDNRSRTLAAPDERQVFWSDIHDFKIEVAAIIENVLKYLGINDVPVLNDGVFRASALTNEAGATRPVITVGRTSDVGFRRALGDKLISTIGGNALLSDPCGIVPEGTPVDIFAEWSTEQIDVTISDMDSFRANQMYRVVKKIMIFGAEELRKRGYEDVKRTNGVDEALQVDSEGSGVVFMKILSYSGVYRDEVASLSQIASLIAQRQTIASQGASTSVTANL